MMVYHMNNSENILLLIIIHMEWDISKPQFPPSELKFYHAMPVEAPILRKAKSLLTRNSRCRCTFHFCVLVSL